MRLFVGLGNPGARYAGHRHNIGFMALDAVARRHGASPWRKRFRGVTADALIGGERVLLLKPETFMNDSGLSVGDALRFLKVDGGDLVVFHDELDLPPGKLRVKRGGGNAGHNGLRSISALCGNDYRRARMGIGHPGHKDLVQGYVLRDFGADERPWVGALLAACADNAPLLAAGQDAEFQNRVHRATEPSA